MESHDVKPEELRQAVVKRGYFPEVLRIEDYPADFISQILVGAWSAVFRSVEEARQQATLKDD
jgi:hypothetical protein